MHAMTRRMTAYTATTKGILIGVIAFTAGGAIVAGVVSVWDRAAIALEDPALQVCEQGEDHAPHPRGGYAFAATHMARMPHGVGTVWQPRLSTADLLPTPSLGERAAHAFRTVFSCTPRSTPS